ncbi:MAG: glutathione S-transferase, partial [Hyphomicrobiaceae bacterium]
MKIFYSPTSPYVRKVMVCAHELGLADKIEKLSCAASPINRDKNILAQNPLGQVPTLITDEGQMLADSRVICEYLDHIGGNKLFPRTSARWQAIVDQAMADGILGAALLARYETALRPGDKLWADWLNGQMDKINTTLAALEAAVPKFADRVDIGTISYACALSYLDLRFPTFDWRGANPKAAAWYKAFE